MNQNVQAGDEETRTNEEKKRGKQDWVMNRRKLDIHGTKSKRKQTATGPISTCQPWGEYLPLVRGR